MRRYEIYNPSIPEEGEKISNEGLPEYDLSQQTEGQKATHRRVVTGKRKEKTTNKTQNNETKTGYVKLNKIVSFFQSPTLRWLLGLLLSLFAVSNPSSLYNSITVLIIVVFPVPGPPVMTQTL